MPTDSLNRLPDTVVRFGVFEADLRSDELRRSGVRVRIQELPFRTLKLFLSRPNEVITREEFRQALWPDDVFVDFDLGTRSAIKRLRDTLGDSAENPIFVETVDRRGYRWIAPVQSEPSSPVPFGARPSTADQIEVRLDNQAILSAASADIARRDWNRVSNWKMAGIVAVAAAAIAAGILGLGPLSRRPGADSIAVLPFANGSGDPSTEYLSDGITESLIGNLTHMPQLKVKSRSSVFHYKGKDVDAQKVGNELGVSALVCLLNNGDDGNSETSHSLLGPFWRLNSPRVENGGSIVRSDTPGDPLFITGRVVDPAGRPVAGAEVDIWHASPVGLYENQDPGQADMNLRGKFTTDGDGRFWLQTVKMVGYPIPTDGVVGRLLGAQQRHPMRPAHLHALVVKAGYKVLISQVYDPDDPHIDDDVQFGVTRALMGDFVRHDRPHPLGSTASVPWYSLDYTYVMEPGETLLPRPPIK